MVADEDTKSRIAYLALVGTALQEASNEKNYQTDFFVAKDALIKFADAIKKLELDPQSSKGMDDLITYLQGKIDRRLNNAVATDTVD